MNGTSTEHLFACFDPRNGLDVPFKSYSDAQFAHLLLRYNFSRDHIQLLLDMIRDPHFSPNDVSFKDAADVDLVVATYLKGVSHKSPVPCFIVEQVADTLADEVDMTFSCMVSKPTYTTSSVAYATSLVKTLKQMSLVNSLWRSPAQQALMRRVVFDREHHFHDFPSQQICRYGSFVREIHLHDHKGTPSAITRTPVILSRMSHIRGLDIYMSSKAVLHILLEALPNLQSLEVLQISTSDDPWSTTKSVGSSQTNYKEDFALPEGQPGSTLQTIIIKNIWKSAPLAALSWLLRARGSFAPRKLVLGLNTIPLLVQAAGPSTARTLEVLLVTCGLISSRPIWHKALQDFLDDCFILKRFGLGVRLLAVGDDTGTVLSLPRTLECLNVTYFTHDEWEQYMSLASFKDRLGSLLSLNKPRMPCFRTLIIPAAAWITSRKSRDRVSSKAEIQELTTDFRVELKIRSWDWDIEG